MDTERHVQRAVELGRQNASIVELIKNWCKHIRIEKMGGGGLIEELEGLPIGPRYLTCPHAAASGLAGANLEHIALDFHARNCAGCNHREPVGLPNLSELVDRHAKAAAERGAAAAARDVERVEAQRARDVVRQSLRAGLSPASLDIIDQIEEIDHRVEGATADRLVETARIAADTFTGSIIDYIFDLLEKGESWFDNAGLRVLRLLNVDLQRLTRCSLLCIPRYYATETAADILVENIELVDEALIGAALPGLIFLAFPRRVLFSDDEDRKPPNPEPLKRLYKAFPAAVETELKKLLERTDTYAVGEAARGLTVLANTDKLLPVRHARILISKLVRDPRLLQATGYHGDDATETANEVMDAVVCAFEAAPAEVEKLLTAFLMGISEAGEVRVFNVYKHVLRPGRQHHAEVNDATRIAMKRVMWHATQTDRAEVLREISYLVPHHFPQDLAGLGAEDVDGLVGAAILIQAKLDQLKTEPAIHDPSGLVGLERHNRQTTLRTLRTGFIRWAAAGAATSTVATTSYCEVLGNLSNDGHDAIKADMIGCLNELMDTAASLNAALPHLYTAMLGSSSLLRARAADAFGELNHRQLEDLPDLAIEAFIALLNDPYVIVHQHAVRALRRLWLPDAWKRRVKAALAGWTRTYAGGRSDDEFLVFCLDLYIDRYAPEEEFIGQAGSALISLLMRIEPYIVAEEINTFSHALRSNENFVELLIWLIRDPTAWDIRHDELMRALAGVPISNLRNQVSALERLAQEPAVRERHIDGSFIQLFTRAGAWTAAERLAATALSEIPDDTWNRTVKFATAQLHLATQFEAALANAETGHAMQLCAEWRSVEDAIEKDWIENEKRRDPLGGVFRPN